MRRRRQRGFTLIELMVVVAIIAILGGLVISVSSRPVGAIARNMSEQVVSLLNFAKLRAQSTRRVHKLIFKQGTIWVQAADQTGLVVSPGASYGAAVQTMTFPTGVHIHDIAPAIYPTAGAVGAVTDNTGLEYTLLIRPDGQVIQPDQPSQPPGATIFISDGLHQFRVIVYHVTGGTYAREQW